MTDHNENRRVRMTKRLMKDAMLDLLEQKELAKISVTAVCDAADIHRSTFYNYYANTSDLLTEIEQDILNQIPLPPKTLDQQTQKQLLTETKAFFDFVKQNEKTFRILFSDLAGGSFTEKMVDFLCTKFIPIITIEDEMSELFIQQYIANGTVGMLKEWINTGFPISSQRIAEMMYFLSRKISS